MPQYDQYGNVWRPVSEQLGPASPDEERSLAGSVLDTGLSGLSWLGGILSKPKRILGGVAGALTGNNFGNAQELLNAVPFSDRMGLTDPSQEIHGSHLLGGDENTPFLSAQGLGGLGLDIAMDPLTYLSFGAGALTKAGEAARKLGLTKGLTGAQRAAGFAVNSPEALALAKAMGGALKGTEKLGGHIGFGFPFMGNNWGTADLSGLGSGIASAAGAIPGASKVGNYIADKTEPLRRGLAGMFDETVMGGKTAKEQEYGRLRYAAEQEAKVKGLGDVNDIRMAHGPDALQPGKHGLQELRMGREGAVPVEELSQGAQAALPLVDDAFRSRLAAMQDAGLPVKAMDPGWSKGSQYLPRSVLEPEIDVARMGPRGTGTKGIRTTSMLEREEVYKNIPGGTETINKMVMDPVIGTTARTAQSAEEATAHIMNAYGIGEKHARDLGEALYALDPKRRQIGFFSKSPMTDIESGLVHADQALASTKAMNQFLAGEAVANVKPPGGKSLLDVLNNVGMGNEQAQGKMLAELARAGKLPPEMAQWSITGKNMLGNHYVPREIADIIENGIKPFSMPEILEPALKIIDGITNFTKSYLTSIFPSFNVRNLLSGIWQNSGAVGWQTLPESYGAAAKVLRGETVPGIAERLFKGQGLTDEAATRLFGKTVFQHGITGGGHVQDIGGATQELALRVPGAMPGRQSGFAAGAEYAKGFFGQGTDYPGAQVATLKQKINPFSVGTDATFAPAAAGRRFGNEIEDLGRTAGMYGLMSQGYVPDMAAAITKTAHVDYSALTPFESQVMKRLMPFYSWFQGNVPHQIRQIMEQPGGQIATAVKASAAARDQGGFTPGNLGQGLAVPIGKEDNGNQRFLSSLGLPFEQLGDITSLRGLAGNLNPLLKYPIEQATGQQMFSGRDLRDLHSRVGDVTGVAPPQAFENLIMNSPASRVIGTGSTLVDPRKTILDKILNLGTGARVSDVDMTKARSIALNDAIENELRGTSGISNFQRLSVRPDQVQNLSERDKALMRLYLAEEQRKRQAAGQR